MAIDITQVHQEHGWTGACTRQQAPGAEFANESWIKKAIARADDSVPVGALGTVLGSLLDAEKGIYYFVEWDSHPRHAVTQVGWKLAKA